MRELGDILEGRPNLGDQMPVLVYRLFEMSMYDILQKEFGNERADELFRAAGFQSGVIFAKSYLDKNLSADEFMEQLQEKLAENKIGILRIERADLESREVVLSVYEDLDCSGLPVTDEVVCVYDEGFIAGILEYYTGHSFRVREIDCWASGERVCRFQAKGK